jgi:uncharacterized membrane protein
MRIDLGFLLLATLLLIIGVVLGIAMAASHNHVLTPVHAHINLVGWASLALYGLTYRAYPELMEHRLAKVHFLFAAASAILMGPGIGLAVLYQFEPLAIISALMWLVGAICFLIQLLRLVSGRREAPVPAE